MSKTSDAIQEIRALVRERGLWRRGAALVVGVSGGLDSMVLLHLLSIMARRDGLKLTVAHLNHGLRPAEARREQALVVAAAQRWGWPCVTGRLTRPKQGPGNLQERLRRRRYAFFGRVLRRARGDAVATAHHADDQVETFLMRLIRGAGLTGLRGIQPRAAPFGFAVVRPLLTLPKRRLREVAREQKLKFLEDSSNAKPDYLRNRVRRRLVPQFTRENPRFVGNLARQLLAIQEELERLNF